MAGYVVTGYRLNRIKQLGTIDHHDMRKMPIVSQGHRLRSRSQYHLGKPDKQDKLDTD